MLEGIGAQACETLLELVKRFLLGVSQFGHPLGVGFTQVALGFLVDTLLFDEVGLGSGPLGRGRGQTVLGLGQIVAEGDRFRLLLSLGLDGLLGLPKRGIAGGLCGCSGGLGVGGPGLPFLGFGLAADRLLAEFCLECRGG